MICYTALRFDTIGHVHLLFHTIWTDQSLALAPQNNIIHTGQGLAQLHQMYNKGISPHFL